MTERIIELVLEESKWLSFALLMSILVVSVRVYLRGRPDRLEIAGAMDLFYGCLIGIMGSGHILAVTVKVFQGIALRGSLWILYPLGIALAVPAWWLALHTVRSARNQVTERTKTVALNAWLGVSLLAFGPHNWPLALPAALNIGYRLQSHRVLGRMIVTLTVVAYLVLFGASLIFLASGQSFEQFSGIE